MRPNQLIRSIALIALCFARVAIAQQITVVPEKTDGIYKLGDTIRWTVTITDGKPADVTNISAGLKLGHADPLKPVPIDLSTGEATIETKLTEPNTVLLIVRGTVAGKPVRGLGGAVADPAHMARSAPRPDDFDTFWDDQLKALRAIPMDANLEPGESADPSTTKPNAPAPKDYSDVDYAKITLDNINSTHVYGQIARPKKEGKYPALLMFQYAGVYALPKSNVTSRAKQGWLAMNIMAHDLPLDRDEKFYKDQADGPLKGYDFIGEDDREKCYFRRMLLGCVRAVDYLKTRDDWDNKTLVLMGTSQGGMQTLATAGLCSGITAMIANVPGGCDMTAALAGRVVGFPFYGHATPKSPKVMDTVRYYDSANFAPHIKCPALVGTGLIDETCPSPGVFVAFNQIAGPKEIFVMPLSDHQGRGGTQKPLYNRADEWLTELKNGKLPEPKVTEGFEPPAAAK